MKRVMPVAVFAALAVSMARAEVSHEIEGRVQVGVAYDSNVLEELSHVSADQALQLFGTASYRLRPSSRIDLQTTLRLGIHRYREIEDDSRVLGEGLVNAVYHVGAAAVGGVLELQGRDYADSTATRGYGLVKAGAFLRAELGGFGVQLDGSRTELDYRVTPGAEQVGGRVDATLRRQLSRDVLVRLQAGSGSFDFDRPQVQLAGDELTSSGRLRKDEFARVALEVTYVRRAYVSMEYTFLTNDSNSFGSSYFYHRIDAAFRTRLGDASTTLGLIGRLEARTYRQDLAGYTVINFDSEREENNALTLEIGRAVLPDTSVRFRLGWHHSESIFRDRLYDKILAETHLEWRF